MFPLHYFRASANPRQGDVCVKCGRPASAHPVPATGTVKRSKVTGSVNPNHPGNRTG